MRKDRIENYFQKKDQLTVANPEYAARLSELFDWMVVSDHIKEDATTTLLGNKSSQAQIICKQEAVTSGIEEITYLLKTKTNIKVVNSVRDGVMVEKGDELLRISGSIKELLGYERIILNIIGRMSGIATYTHEFLSRIKDEQNPPLLVSTRKTPWMMLDKKAVCIGGGGTHRLTLSDFALVKNTHLFASLAKIETIVEPFMQTNKFFEIEVSNPDEAYNVIQVLEKAHYKEAAIMLDNVSSSVAKDFMDSFKKHSFYNHVYIEASGEVTKENVLEWAKTGVDVISSGSLTHSASTCNVSMKILTD